MRRWSQPPLWVWWIPLIWLVSSPWVGFTWDPQWQRVEYVPFAASADKPRDVVLNILLFVPFGMSAAWRRPPAPALTRASVFAVLVSVSAESMQLFSTRRYPSATDVAAALIGSAIGAAAAVLFRKPGSL